MKQNIYAVLDIKAETYGKPFIFTTHGEAIRAFGQACKQKDSSFNTNPEDFRLHHIGEMDIQTGLVEPTLPAPIHLASALDYVKN